MTPATLSPDDLPIYKGAQWAHTFSLKQTGTNTPVDLTGLGPFVLTVKRPSNDSVLVQGTVAFVGSATLGQLSVLLTAAQTDLCPIGTVRIGLRDRVNNPYVEGVCNVRFFAPDPAAP
jgi:hypothetical protein